MWFISLKIASMLVSLAGFAAMYVLLRPIINGAVYFPTTADNVQTIKSLSQAKRGDKVVDLGSGDGRITMAFAQDGITAHGYEINPFLVFSSKRKIKEAGLDASAKIIWKSFWKADLSAYSIVIVYGIPYIMGRLEKKLRRELKPGTRVIANIYGFPGWQEKTKTGGVYLYTV